MFISTDSLVQALRDEQAAKGYSYDGGTIYAFITGLLSALITMRYTPAQAQAAIDSETAKVLARF